MFSFLFLNGDVSFENEIFKSFLLQISVIPLLRHNVKVSQCWNKGKRGSCYKKNFAPWDPQ